MAIQSLQDARSTLNHVRNQIGILQAALIASSPYMEGYATSKAKIDALLLVLEEPRDDFNFIISIFDEIIANLPS